MKFSYTFLLFFVLANAEAAYYDVLPKGVRNITYRFVQTGEISGSYGNSGDLKGYNINANINADAIKGFNGAVDTYLGTLSAADYANFSFGTFEGSATSKVSAQGFGGGYGLTNRMTVYGFIPFYSARVDLKIQRTQKGRNSSDGSLIQIENLPDVDVRLIQSLFVNFYHYQPLGQWKATGFGDAEIGALYQVQKWKNAGALISFGVVAPTGKTDNSDILQDIAFGDGQWDAFYEFGGGYTFNHGNSRWSLDQWTRLTYQFSYETRVRLPDSSTFPVTSREGNAKIKLGNKVATNFQGSYKISDEWGTTLTYSLEYKEPDVYKSDYKDSNTILASATEKISHTGRLAMNYSTLSLYQHKQFIAPIGLTLAFQSIFGGKNIPKYDRADFEIRLFF